jgi:hypothetical protein
VRSLAEKPKRQLVDALQEPKDFECIMYGMLGFSRALIASLTKLTEGQVQYRLNKYAVSVRAYRDGESGLAKQVIRNAREYSEKQVLTYLKKHMLE